MMMGNTMKQLADISLFQSLEHGNVVRPRQTVVDPFASSRDVSVQNVDMTLSMLARGIEPNPTLQKLLGVLEKLGSLGLAEKTLQGFQASSIKSVIDALIYGIGDTNLLRKAGINVSENAEKPAEAGKPAPAAQTASTPKPEALAAKSPKATQTNPKKNKVEAAPIEEPPQSKGDLEEEYWKRYDAYQKVIKACDEGKISREEALPIMRSYKEIKDRLNK